MNLHKLIFTENACYKAGKKITPKGIMVHSTGANNPRLSRYIGPDDGLVGPNKYGNHWNQIMGRNVCVHGFIGLLADGTVATYQTLPWNHRGWHAGSGANGSANNTHISFEICEDGLTDKDYFSKVYQEAVDLCVYLCKLYHLTEKDIIDHREGQKLGIASNHGDVAHWFPKHGKSMDALRADVKTRLGSASTGAQKPVEVKPTPSSGLYRVQVGAFSKKAYAEQKLKAVQTEGFPEAFLTYDGKLWRVQVGAFSKKANADAYLAKVQTAGFSGFVTKSGGSTTADPAPTPEIKKGSTVRVRKGAKTYKGTGLASFVYTRDHKVQSISGDRVVITFGGIVVAAVRLDDLILV